MLLALGFVILYGQFGIGRDTTPRVHDLRNGAACIECHQSTASITDVAAEPDGCYRCHPGIKEAAKDHHPIDLPVQHLLDSRLTILDGKMNCSTCHDPHGKTRYPLLLRRPGNSLCLACHDSHTTAHDAMKTPGQIREKMKD